MPPSRSGSMAPLRRSRSASMSSLAQVDLSTLDTELVLDYARKVMHLQLQPATSSEKMQMLFALSQKLLKWFLEDRDQSQKQLTLTSRTAVAIPSLNIQKLVPESAAVSPPKALDAPSVASRILASAVAPMPSTVEPMIPSDLTFPTTSTPPVHYQIQSITDNSAIRPAEVVIPAIRPSQTNKVDVLQSVQENEPFTDPASTLPTPEVLAPQEPATYCSPNKPDALEVYLQVQRSVICMQKYARGFMARRRFFRALEELLQGRA